MDGVDDPTREPSSPATTPFPLLSDKQLLYAMWREMRVIKVILIVGLVAAVALSLIVLLTQ